MGRMPKSRPRNAPIRCSDAAISTPPPFGSKSGGQSSNCSPRRKARRTRERRNCPATSEGPAAIDGDPVHDPAIAIIVIQGIVLHAAIVPKRDRTGLPAETARVFRSDGMLEQKLQQGAAFLD